MYNSRSEADMYDIIYRIHYERQVSVFDRLIRMHQLPGNQLLDMCCGTGTHLRIYNQLGYDVTGVDLSEAMVDKAKRNVTSATIVHGDMQSFLPKNQYDVITCHSFSILHNTTIDDIMTTLVNCFSILRKSGVLIFDMLDKGPVSLNVREDRPEQISIDADSPLFSEYGDEFNLSYDVQWNYSESRQLFTVSINLRIEGRNGITEIEDHMNMGAFSISEITRQMEEIGFGVTMYSRTADHIGALSDGETEAIIVATKY